MKKSLSAHARACSGAVLIALLLGAGATQAQSPLAKLVVRDLLTGRIERIPLQSFTLPEGHVRWSTGDMATSQGQLMAWRMGQRVYVAQSGSLWTVPLQPGSSGEAQIESRRGRVGGTIRWKAVPAADGELTLEADVTLDSIGNQFMPQVAARGTWTARYEGLVPVPVEARTVIRGAAQGGPGTDRSESKLEWPAVEPERTSQDPAWGFEPLKDPPAEDAAVAPAGEASATGQPALPGSLK